MRELSLRGVKVELFTFDGTCELGCMLEDWDEVSCADLVALGPRYLKEIAIDTSGMLGRAHFDECPVEPQSVAVFSNEEIGSCTLYDADVAEGTTTAYAQIEVPVSQVSDLRVSLSVSTTGEFADALVKAQSDAFVKQGGKVLSTRHFKCGRHLIGKRRLAGAQSILETQATSLIHLALMECPTSEENWSAQPPEK